MDMSHKGYFYFFLQLATQHFVAVAGCKTGVLHVKSFLQLVSQQKVARKIASCNMAFTLQLYLISEACVQPPYLDPQEKSPRELSSRFFLRDRAADHTQIKGALSTIVR